MIGIESTLENLEAGFSSLYSKLEQSDFTLGSNWEYDHGYFDRYLDVEHKVWVRIPFQVTSGTFDGDSAASDAVIRLGAPFVLKHVYNEGLDPHADASVTKALVDQFQSPVEMDAPVEAMWVAKAQELLAQTEAGFSAES